MRQRPLKVEAELTQSQTGPARGWNLPGRDAAAKRDRRDWEDRSRQKEKRSSQMDRERS